MTEYNELSQNSSTIGDWVDRHVIKAKKVQRDGEELNPFFLPEFVNMLSSRAKEFPLWTSVGMDYTTSHATSSHVEGYFNDIKTRVLKTGPIRVDKFIIKHVRDIHGATLLFSSRMINFNAERYAQNTALTEKERENKMNELHGKLAMNVEEGTKIKSSTKLRVNINNEEKTRFGQSVSDNNENKMKNSQDSFVKIIESNINEKKMYFDQLSSNNKQDKFIASPEQSVKDDLLRMKHIESLSCFNEIPTNDIKNYSCNSNLFTTENWQEKCEIDELVFDYSLDADIKDVSY